MVRVVAAVAVLLGVAGTVSAQQICECAGKCKARGDPHLRRFDGAEIRLEEEGQRGQWETMYGASGFALEFIMDLQNQGTYMTHVRVGGTEYVADEECQTEEQVIGPFTNALGPSGSDVLDQSVQIEIKCMKPTRDSRCPGGIRDNCKFHFDVFLTKNDQVVLGQDIRAADFLEIEDYIQADGFCLPSGSPNATIYKQRAAEWECQCSGTPPPSSDFGQPTVSPTMKPTGAPSAPWNPPDTQAPTNSPTVLPTTLAPSIAPTALPTTKSPTTQSPTTQSPTTKSPTTAAPSAAPTGSPTTQSPTTAPSAAPTAAPSATPTASPTKPTTKSPTKAPTNSPTESPVPVPPSPSPFNSNLTCSVWGDPHVDCFNGEQFSAVPGKTNNLTNIYTMGDKLAIVGELSMYLDENNKWTSYVEKAYIKQKDEKTDTWSWALRVRAEDCKPVVPKVLRSDAAEPTPDKPFVFSYEAKFPQTQEYVTVTFTCPGVGMNVTINKLDASAEAQTLTPLEWEKQQDGYDGDCLACTYIFYTGEPVPRYDADVSNANFVPDEKFPETRSEDVDNVSPHSGASNTEPASVTAALVIAFIATLI
jgi:hypothetical protein